ncbi:MAG: Cof-type HAD-IIB family hydrolase [Oscillospiraceae bacterium]|nr:Cof-type HAD-IIB family hydrolase [Oscillospiraceae bacterium]
MGIKLIAFDLDGTLLNDRKEIPRKNREALLAAAEAGVLPVPATGRIMKGMPEELTALGCCRYFIISNGAVVYDLQKDRVLFRACIAPELGIRLCEYMDRLPVLYDCYRDGMGYMTADMYARAPEFFETEPEILKLIGRLRTPVPELKKDIREKQRPLEKLQMFFRDMDERSRQLDLLPQLFPEVIVSSSTKNNVEINSREAGKGKGLLQLCGLLDIAPEETAAFGDGLNDSDMLEAAGLGCAMENASPAVKESADLVIGNNNDGAVGEEIYRLLAGRTD